MRSARIEDDGEGCGPTLSSRVPAWADGLQLADYLPRRFPYLDVAAWLRELAAGRVAHGGRTARADTLVQRGDRVDWQRTQPEPEVATDWRAVFEHDEFVVVDKPAHLPCHADGAFVRHTLVHMLQRHYGRATLVHRLDRETSGLMVVARSDAARRALDAQFRAGTVQKTYLAVARGRVAADFVATGAIGHATDSAIALRRAVVADDTPNAQPATTEFVVLARGDDRTLLRCHPRTGRTHQIRVHLTTAGHPLLGDKLYGRSDADYLAFVQHVKAGGSARWSPDGGPDRQLLHAAELRLAHPITGAPCIWSAPLPADMVGWAPTAASG